MLRHWVDKLRQKPTSAAWRIERDIFEKVDRDFCRNTDMSYRFIEDHRDRYPVRLMCAVLEVSTAGYYAWRERPASERTKSSAALLAAIRQVHQDSSGRYRSPRGHAALHRRGVAPAVAESSG